MMKATVPVQKAKVDVVAVRPSCRALKKAGLIYSYSFRGYVEEAGKQYASLYFDVADGVTHAELEEFVRNNR